MTCTDDWITRLSDCGCVSRERRRRYGDSEPAEEDTPSWCVRACVAAKSVHFPHKEGRNRAEAYLDRVQIDIARSNAHGPRNRLVERNMSISLSTITVGRCTRAHCDSKTNAPEAFKILKAAAENKSQKRMREVMTDNARELSIGEMR